MMLRWLLATVLFIPQITLAQKPGVISDTIPCKRSSKQTYSLYLPKSYSDSRAAGLIMFFDPGARGRMPVVLYQKIADKYSLVLACSNNSQNGAVDVSLRAGSAVLEDVLDRFNINKDIILVSGFSGGGRTAVDMATRDRSIAGVIACGAAFPSPDAIKMETRLAFAEVIGQVDMNYQEALTASEYLQSIHNPASLTVFYGGHQWPPADAYEEAVQWHLFRINDGADLKQDIVRKKLRSAQVKIDSGYLFEASNILKPLLGMKPVDSMFALVQKDKRTRAQAKDVARINTVERQMQQNFYYAYTRHMAYAAPDSAYHPEFWKSFRRECEKMMQGDAYKKCAGLRLIDYGWRMCAEQYYFLLNDEQYRQAAMSARIWALMMPNNANPCIQAAKAFALQKRKPEMLDYLRQAVARGIRDKNAVIADPAFAEYSRSEDFVKVFQ